MSKLTCWCDSLFQDSAIQLHPTTNLANIIQNCLNKQQIKHNEYFILLEKKTTVGYISSYATASYKAN